MEGKTRRGFQEPAIRMTWCWGCWPPGTRDPSRSRPESPSWERKIDDWRGAGNKGATAQPGSSSHRRRCRSVPCTRNCHYHIHKTSLAIYFSNQGGTQEMQGYCSTAKQPMRATYFLGLKDVRWPGLDHIEKGLTFGLFLKALRKAMEST
jgi:hypothetical protein